MHAYSDDTPPPPPAGEPRAFEDILVREYPRIRRLAARYGIPESEIDDAASEVVAKAWLKRESFAGRAAMSTWVTRIAMNHYSNLIRHHRIRSLFILSAREEQRQRDTRDEIRSREARAIAARCIRRLSRGQRDAFVLRYLEEMSFAEVAEVLGITEIAARARAFEARRKMREWLKAYDL